MKMIFGYFLLIFSYLWREVSFRYEKIVSMRVLNVLSSYFKGSSFIRFICWEFSFIFYCWFFSWNVVFFNGRLLVL